MILERRSGRLHVARRLHAEPEYLGRSDLDSTADEVADDVVIGGRRDVAAGPVDEQRDGAVCCRLASSRTRRCTRGRCPFDVSDQIDIARPGRSALCRRWARTASTSSAIQAIAQFPIQCHYRIARNLSQCSARNKKNAARG